jgi:hypothetical protein
MLKHKIIKHTLHQLNKKYFNRMILKKKKYILTVLLITLKITSINTNHSSKSFKSKLEQEDSLSDETEDCSNKGE